MCSKVLQNGNSVDLCLSSEFEFESSFSSAGSCSNSSCGSGYALERLQILLCRNFSFGFLAFGLSALWKLRERCSHLLIKCFMATDRMKLCSKAEDVVRNLVSENSRADCT